MAQFSRTSSGERTVDLTDPKVIQAVWEKGQIVPNNDPAKWRKDVCKAWMQRSAYGNRDSQYGWEIDHIDPNGGDVLSNLRPLQWKNNLSKSDGRLVCAVTADGVNNREI